MNQKEREYYLIDYLLQEKNLTLSNDQYCFDLYRALVNTREPMAISDEYLQIEDQYLKTILNNKNIWDTDLCQAGITLYKGDITTIKADAIVNAANNQLLGCFIPGHTCIDNAIHTFAGVRLRLECHEMMQRQKFLEPTGKAKITKAYNLPNRYILHTVGPIIRGSLQDKHKSLLKMCYMNCLKKAEENHLKSIVFCCISTGVFGFPQREAAKIAIQTVKDYLKDSQIEKVIFNVFKDTDEKIYQELLEE